jgi:septum formation protein
MDHDSTRLWLASASPRRRALLLELGLRFNVESPEIDEATLPGETPDRTVARLARIKAEKVAANHPAAFALGADTLVALQGKSLGKPRDVAEARAMLASLSGQRHAVWTAVALARVGRPTLVRAVVARVAFRQISAQEIAAYVATGEPLDKAGAYALQGGARAFVAALEGEESTVIGLPLATTRELLAAAGFGT